MRPEGLEPSTKRLKAISSLMIAQQCHDDLVYNRIENRPRIAPELGVKSGFGAGQERAKWGCNAKEIT
jgi:hypothetical protein